VTAGAIAPVPAAFSSGPSPLEVDLVGAATDVRSAAIEPGGRSARTPTLRARVRPLVAAVAMARPAVATMAAASAVVPPNAPGDVAVEATKVEAVTESSVAAVASTFTALIAASTGDAAERVGEFDAASGLGDSGDRGLGEGAGGGRQRRDLRARVIGAPAREATSPDGTPFISNREATALRVRDYFPRLPESEWPGRSPYLVTLDVCVSAQGVV